jgi:hypothetical protein
MGVKGKVQEWCRLVWMEVEMWEMGFDLLGTPPTLICLSGETLLSPD